MDKQAVYIIGAGGHARAVAALVTHVGKYTIGGFFDDNFIAGEHILGIPVLGTVQQLPAEGKIILAAGDNTQRQQYFEKYGSRIIKENIAHSSVITLGDPALGNSNLIFPKVSINALASIGQNNIINTGAIIEHETVIGSHCHISLNAVVAGRVSIGNNCFIGAGAIVKDGISICDHVVVGSGAVVIKNITQPGTYIGVPAKKIK